MFNMLLQISVYISISIYSIILLLYNVCNGRDIILKCTATKYKNGDDKTIIKEIVRIDYNSLVMKPNILQHYIEHSIPVIITNTPNNLFLFNNLNNQKLQNDGTKMRIREYIFPTLTKSLDDFINSYINKKVMYMAEFSGNYPAGFSHIDSMSSYNLYYLKCGRKEVYIIPPECTAYVNMKHGIDSIYVEDDSTGVDKLEWLNKLPHYYHFFINDGDVLLFNNSKCIHKFINKIGNELAYSIRLFSTDASSLILYSDIFNWPRSKHFTEIYKNNGIVRDSSYI